MRIDSHHHFWIYDSKKYDWINDKMAFIRKDFEGVDLAPFVYEYRIDGTVAVQAQQSLDETEWLLKEAEKYPFVKGVVGWVDLKAKNAIDQLSEFAKSPYFKGVRHVVQSEPAGFMLQKKFQKGIGKLRDFNLTYDILIYPNQLNEALTLVQKFPDQPFVLDHMAKPMIAKGELEPWRKDIIKLAACQNVYCKISGLITEADWDKWKYEDLKPYLEVVLNAFGVDRIMYGSDWPVCLVAGSYTRVISVANTLAEYLLQDEKLKFYGENASKFYKL